METAARGRNPRAGPERTAENPVRHLDKNRVRPYISPMLIPLVIAVLVLVVPLAVFFAIAARRPPLARRHLDLDGLHCQHCVAATKRALEAVDGVASAKVTLSPQAAEVALSRPVPDEALRAAVEDAGFRVTAVS